MFVVLTERLEYMKENAYSELQWEKIKLFKATLEMQATPWVGLVPGQSGSVVGRDDLK